MKDGHVLVCDLGGTRLRVAVATLEGTIDSKRVIATPAGDPGALVRTMREVLTQSRTGVVGAVVGLPGPVDYAQGKPVRLPNCPSGTVTLAPTYLRRSLGFLCFWPMTRTWPRWGSTVTAPVAARRT